ncbi:MAG: ATPase [Lachnospiraceae bacterium]
MLYERAKKEYETLTEQICSLKCQLETFPPGKLICCNHKTYTKWYHKDQGQREYIPKSNRRLAQQLAQKKYLTYLLQDLEKEQKALTLYLNHHSNEKQSDSLLLNHPEYQELLSQTHLSLSKELTDWMASPYNRNTSHPESLSHKGIANTLLRSKSEVLIDMALRKYNIPFRYECALELNNATLFPDFTIRHPHTGELHYWEHFGLMDNHSYTENAIAKIRLYTSNGIIPGDKLITTYETRNSPLTIQTIEKTIEFYFL